MTIAADATPTVSSRRAILLRLGVLAVAVVVGLVLNHFVRRHMLALQELAASDPIAARTTLASEFRIGGLALFGVVCALGMSLVAASLRAARAERFPPAGVWGCGATRVVTGPAARRAAYAGVVLGSLLVLCALAGGWLSWEMSVRLLACRAGVPPSGHAP